MGAFGSKVFEFAMCALPCLVLVCICAAPASADEFKRARRAYLKAVKSRSLGERTLARDTFARAHGHRALEEIAHEYDKPRAPKIQDRALIASILGHHATTEQGVAVLDDLRKVNTQREDAWLWYQYVRREVALNGGRVAYEIAQDARRDAFLRAAALEALADVEHDAKVSLSFLHSYFSTLPTDVTSRMVLVESGARLLWTCRTDRKDVRFSDAAKALIAQMGRKDTPARTRLTVARYLERIYRTGGMYLDADKWLARIEWERKGEKGRYAPPRWHPTFVGIPATGSRIAYVIDASGSMGELLTAEELKDLRKPPEPVRPKRAPVVTGGPHKDGEKTKGDKRGRVPSISELPWDSIKTRYDAVREFLKLSLRTLHPEQEFVVVTFATNVKLLKKFKGPVQATRRNVALACKRLDRRGPGGNTNLHGGLRKAFALSLEGEVEGPAYVSPKALLGGCDTIYVLTDGVPTVDEFEVGGFGTGSPFSIGRPPGMEPVFYNYMSGHQISDDVRRMNLFRKCEIHCVGVGDANRALFRQLAGHGHGMLRFIGRGGLEEVTPESIRSLPEERSRSVAWLVKALEASEMPAERIRAAERLGMMRALDALPPLVEALADTDESVRQAALYALSRISGLRKAKYALHRNADSRTLARVQAAWRAWISKNGRVLREKIVKEDSGVKK